MKLISGNPPVLMSNLEWSISFLVDAKKPNKYLFLFFSGNNVNVLFDLLMRKYYKIIGRAVAAIVCHWLYIGLALVQCL